MADTVAATGLQVKQWDDKYFKEYFQEVPFRKFMGLNPTDIIQVKEDLTKKKGDTIHFALVNRLTNDAVTGSNTLEGNEEQAKSRSYALTVDKRRNAVRVAEMEEQVSAIDLREAGRSVLMDWSKEDTRDLVIQALGSVNGVAYASATEAQKDAWLVDNADRCLFGSQKANNAANDHSAALANIDSTSDLFTPASLSLLKRMALSASPKIRPITMKKGGKRFFVCFAGSRVFRDFKNNATVQQAQREVGLEMQNNLLFEGGDQHWDGIIVHEVDDIPVYSGVGAGAIDVQPVYLCGAQALGMGWAKHWGTKTKEFDYGDKYGVAIDGIYDVEKLTFGTGNGDTDDLKDHGVATGFFSAVDDA